MCLAIPGKIKTISGMKAEVEYPGQQNEAFVGEKDVKVGDYVLVQMGVITRKVTEKEAKTAQKAWTKNL